MDEPSRAIHPRPTPLPETISEWTRHIKTKRTLNDLVEDLHRVLWDESEEYREYLEAVWDEDAVEGSLAVDNIKAAELIRARATMEGGEVAKKKLATIVKALNVVLQRYHHSRNERRRTVKGVLVPRAMPDGILEGGNGD